MIKFCMCHINNFPVVCYFCLLAYAVQYIIFRIIFQFCFLENCSNSNWSKFSIHVLKFIVLVDEDDETRVCLHIFFSPLLQNCFVWKCAVYLRKIFMISHFLQGFVILVYDGIQLYNLVLITTTEKTTKPIYFFELNYKKIFKMGGKICI